MRSSARTGRTGNARQPQEPANKTIPLIGSIVAAVAVIILFVLYLVSFSGENRRNPIVLFSGADGNFPVVSMQNTLHRAGFDLQRFEGGELDPDRQYILVSLDDNAVSDMAAYRDSDNVLGFVLVCPTIPEEGLPSGFDSSEPSKDIAIFAGKDNSSEVVSMGAPRVIFERISGVDTVYGVPATRGGLFASRCFVSMAQNRYLSLSAFGADEGKELLYSPLFQNELAGYLSITYRDAAIKDASFAGINMWFIMAFVSIFACIFGLCVYLMLLPVVVSDIKQEKVPSGEKLAVAAIGGITVAFAIGVVAMAFSERLRSYAGIILAFLPLVFMFILTLNRFRFIVFDKTDYKSRSKMKRTAFLSVLIALSALFIMLISGDMDTYISHVSAPLIAAVAFVPDLLCATCLLYSDRKSRFVGEGGCSYFGNRVIFLLMLIPSVFAIIFGIIFRQHEITVAGFKGLYTTLVPFILLVPLRRHSDQSLIPGILHGILFAMSVLFVL